MTAFGVWRRSAIVKEDAHQRRRIREVDEVVGRWADGLQVELLGFSLQHKHARHHGNVKEPREAQSSVWRWHIQRMFPRWCRNFCWFADAEQVHRWRPPACCVSLHQRPSDGFLWEDSSMKSQRPVKTLNWGWAHTKNPFCSYWKLNWKSH